MNDLFEEKARCWNERLKKCLDKGSDIKYTQASLAKAMNSKYGMSFTQKSVSRWMSVGNRTENGAIGFPEYGNMIIIADFFKVDIGYLTGETDEDTFTLEKACDYMNLDGPAIETIRNLTDSTTTSSLTNMHAQDIKEVLNKYIMADRFPYMLSCLVNLNNTFLAHVQSRSFASSGLSEEILNEAIECILGPTDFENDPDAEKLRPELRDAIIRVNSTIDEQRELGFEEKLDRYELHEAFEALINELFPRAQDASPKFKKSPSTDAK